MSLVIAHRGASAVAPENTIVAFQKAVDMGSDGIELDVHMTADEEIVVIHDASVDRTSNGEGKVRELSLKELKTYDYGSWFGEEFAGITIPTLDEVLILLKDWDGLLNIEIKFSDLPYRDYENKLVKLVKKYNFKERVIFSSFNHYSLVNIKKIDPSIKTGLLYVSSLAYPGNYAKSLDADAIHPYFTTVTPEVVLNCKENDIKINTYTINDLKTMQKHIDYGVDGIITDYPDRCLSLMK